MLSDRRLTGSDREGYTFMASAVARGRCTEIGTLPDGSVILTDHESGSMTIPSLAVDAVGRVFAGPLIATVVIEGVRAERRRDGGILITNRTANQTFVVPREEADDLTPSFESLMAARV